MSRRRLRVHHHLAYAALRGFLAISRWLPLGVLRGLSRLLVRLALPFARRDRSRSVDHLALAFPGLPRGDRDRLLKRNARHLADVLAEVAWLLHARPDDVDRVCSITGVHHLFDALERGSGAVLVTGHLGNWEMLNARLATAGVPMTIAVRDVYDDRIDAIATRLRTRFGTEVVHRGTNAGRRLFTALKKNRVVGLLIDQDIRDIPGVFVPFFGREAWTPSGAASLALGAKCPVVPAFVHRRADGRHLVEIGPPLPIPAEGSSEERVEGLTAAATAAIESQLRAHPEQWVWMHRRWRTRPDTAAQ